LGRLRIARFSGRGVHRSIGISKIPAKSKAFSADSVRGYLPIPERTLRVQYRAHHSSFDIPDAQGREQNA
jgi:hypothetical protein